MLLYAVHPNTSKGSCRLCTLCTLNRRWFWAESQGLWKGRARKLKNRKRGTTLAVNPGHTNCEERVEEGHSSIFTVALSAVDGQTAFVFSWEQAVKLYSRSSTRRSLVSRRRNCCTLSKSDAYPSFFLLLLPRIFLATKENFYHWTQDHQQFDFFFSIVL